MRRVTFATGDRAHVKGQKTLHSMSHSWDLGEDAGGPQSIQGGAPEFSFLAALRHLVDAGLGKGKTGGEKILSKDSGDESRTGGS